VVLKTAGLKGECMPIAEDIFRTAIQLHQAGNVVQAAALYEQILREQPNHPGAWHLLGVASHQQGDLERAVAYIERAIALEGTKAIYHNNLGVALRALGRLEEAIAAYRRALTLNPSYADGHSNLAVALHETDRPEEALSAFLAALRLQPDHVDALFNLGNLYQDLGRHAEAIEAYQRALEQQPQRAGPHNNLGNALLAERRTTEALLHYRRAVALDPSYAEAHLNLGGAYAEQGNVEEAARCYETACRLRPEKTLWKMRSAALCPVVFQCIAELNQYRADVAAKLDTYRDWPLQVDWRDLARDGFTPSFYLAHHGHNNRPLKEKYAALFERHFPQKRPPLGTGKPRIGFLVTRQHEGGFVRCTSGIIERLDASRFQPIVLCSESVLERCRQSIRRADVEWVGFSGQFPRAVEQIAAARCDVLYHWQIGTDPLDYFLPFVRLAPIQCTGWGTHATTGIAAVDYYLSSRLIEAEEADAHYTETLYRFETFPTYQTRIPPPPPTRRSDFDLPEQGHLYLCPPRLPKFHPDLDPLLRGVLEADPKGYLILLEGLHPYGCYLLRRRFQTTLAGVFDRVIFLPAQTPENFYRLLSITDVLLDTLHYSVGLMGHDAFSLGIPVVTLPGQFNVGRYTLGYYRRMGLEELITNSPEEYIALAVRLGTEPDYREVIHQTIAERSEVLFEDQAAVSGHEAFFEDALAQARRQGYD